MGFQYCHCLRHQPDGAFPISSALDSQTGYLSRPGRQAQVIYLRCRNHASRRLIVALLSPRANSLPT
jgi:hypothetical protein